MEDDERILQGDIVGIEGNTGYSENCAPHLHLEGIASAPGIDGHSRSSITANPTAYSSTNYVVGAFNAPGAAIRQLCLDVAAFLGSCWDWIGWTTGAVQYAPDPAVGHWGSRQAFRLHPGTPILSDGMIAVGRWAQDDAYWVTQGFFASWLGGFMAVGLPAQGQVSGSGSFCWVPTTCVRYQRFQHGFILEHSSQGLLPPDFCPDIAPQYPNQDDQVDLFNDVQGTDGIVSRLGSEDAGLAPYQAWPDAWWDISGDGVIDLFNDVFAVSNAFGADCNPYQ